jgi:hypothetical protein
MYRNCPVSKHLQLAIVGLVLFAYDEHFGKPAQQGWALDDRRTIS